ncbi:MAG: hypothetical protein LC655_07565, partial [Bacteroidales bacterium]|nr:hypothetical protein [Bacteroidales bacterium]
MKKKKEVTFDQLNQWQLMSLRFRRHKLAVGAFFVLIFLYLCAAFAEFIAPQDVSRRNLEYSYCPPHRVGFSFEKGGLYAKGLQQVVDQATLQKSYKSAPERDVPLGW